MHGLVIYLCLLISIFHFSEGKPCPEKSRPHKTRCDAFYKCRELPSNSHVWIPIKCNEGLVYEHIVGTCVLPDEDWECITPSELNSTPKSPTSKKGSKDADIIIVSNEDEATLLLKEDSDNDVQIVLDGQLSSEEQDEQVNDNSLKVNQVASTPNTSELENPSFISQFDSSGDGELVDLEGFPLQAENREAEVNVSNAHNKHSTHSTETPNKQPSSGSNIDPNLTAHLQRLSQLIDGLQQTYQKTEKPQLEMRPDQLNAFLAHFDLKNRYDMMNPSANFKDASTTTTTVPPATTPMVKTSSAAPIPQLVVNKTRQHLINYRMQPETKLLLSNTQPGYASSQIVVNRPEGSVMFTLPQYGSSPEQTQTKSVQAQSHEYNEHEPKVSEETLKTVLELSKQMIAAQNLPKVLPSPGYNGAYYAQPIIQPVILSPQNNPFQQYFSMPNYESASPPRTHYVHHKKTGGYNKKPPGTTIIHNNVIPVHLSSTSSGEREVLDAYGNSLGHFPHLDKHNSNNNDNNKNQVDNNYYNKFMATMTTARPNSMTTMTSQYTGQYTAAFAGEFTQTTPRPFEQQPSPATVANYYTPSPHLSENNVNRVFNSESYPTANSLNMPRPMSAQNLYPTHLDAGQVKIRPNSQKIESMEVEADDANNPSYVNINGNGNNNNNNLHSSHLLTYSNAGQPDRLAMSHQLAPGSYMEQSYAQQQQQHQYHFKPPTYMPKPTPSMSSSSMYSDAAGNLELSMFNTGMGNANVNNNNNGIHLMSGKYPSSLGQLVNFNGNFISLDVFRKSILPLITQSPSAISDLNNVEVITCQTGVRQPNQTDCTRYFVCSKKDGKVLSYSCPPYTGFNKQTRICDATTYAQCGNVPIFNGYTIDENRRLHMETLKVLAEAKRRQEAALKSQNLANLLQQYASKPEMTAPATAPGISSSMEQSMLDSYMVSFPEPNTTSRPQIVIPTPPPISNSSGPVKKRKYYCKEGDKIPDQTSISSYFVCYKNAQGNMKGHKMTCSKALVFCPRTLLCTLASKCTG
ncbi:putative uncharacterized protein DDB_G0282129 [Drosophila grimshawi]|uniref:putative uncharacterized protein DDB_G0282129 n=1 Tax=Drosophila grimshawi TaxID=7222 RepID=UPI001C935A24|nr:putative uncharacterized protein DDB_G0282129 [Drosophila grimshawi]